MSAVISLPVDAVAGRAVFEKVKILFDFFEYAVYNFFFFNDLQRGVTDNTVTEESRVFFRL